jgi:small subunit ribosomal protein S6
MGLNEDILRFMTVSIDEIEEGPSIMMQAKSEKPQRGRSQDSDDAEDLDKE